tara:strand:+ start:8199 stop:8447 length:249 start_codon:yes stop_codon:yes gene_type:complete
MQRITDLLIQKNNSYGNSATQPAKIFSKGSAVESISARIDDKLMRIGNKGINENTLDTVDDLIGYLVLLKIAWWKEEIYEDK